MLIKIGIKKNMKKSLKNRRKYKYTPAQKRLSYARKVLT
jgi:hypothetical protein